MSGKMESEYYKKLNKDQINYSLHKPFSDKMCGSILSEIGAIMLLLPPPPSKLLDLGCGNGWTSNFFAKKGYSVIGKDISPEAIKHAEKDKMGNMNLKFIVGDFEKMDYHNEFDSVVFFDSLHHSTNEENALRSVYKALKPKGVCIISEPGVGHRKTEKSIHAVKKYGTTERDVVPKKVVKIAKKIGFKKYKIYPHSSYLNAALYINRKELPRFEFLEKFFKFNAIRKIIVIIGILFYKKYDGIVLLKK